MMKLINRPEAVVEKMVEGLVTLYPGLERLPGQTVVVRADAAEVRDRQVALISGAAAGTSRRTRGMSGGGCSARRLRATSSPHPARTPCSPRSAR
jgi:triose/dihydroxyacetone kinase / FAD-AMP lyase (cyclizing)